ncbi:PAS domain-containing protein [Croceitalea rosinachiae]|uniref:PAS domain-containing protein n=1 Tax=Croceitalea rosinachiae TaxID=3075596 RepID=A0ABU3A912_9FLAO|nr:PAS domain-containing protein [Croceitalea sp. F388]MDT0606449.1 PAS domain-containing protein [Croceitalea sp. F388]
MKELQHYDKAAHNFYRKQSVLSLPIYGWDIFSKYFQKVCDNLSDLVVLKNISEEKAWENRFPFEKEIIQKKHVIVVTDAELNIVHATKNIFDMNGYMPDEILGKKPKIFQGAETCKETASEISKAVKNKQAFEAVILNYRKDGSTYNCWIKGAPIRNKKGEVVNFIAFEREVA